jgi:hypothetical protein
VLCVGREIERGRQWETTDERRVEQEDGKAGRFGNGSDVVVGACIEVHRYLGPGLLESAYERCLEM